MLPLFIILQFMLLFFMLFHDWIPVPPLNDVKALKRFEGGVSRLRDSMINGVVVFIPLALTIVYFQPHSAPLPASLIVVIFYAIITLGTILSWWAPYFFGSSQKHKKAFSKFKNTHHFLPRRKNNVVPNTLHVILHLQVWICLGISIYFLMS